MGEKVTTLSLSSTLLAFHGDSTKVPLTSDSLTPEKQKKQARIQISVKNTSPILGFLHACLIELNGDHLIIAGTSGIGKSTLAHSLIEQNSGSILAHDWVAVEKEGDKLYASDLNFQDKKIHDRVLVTGLIILEKEDSAQRSAYFPTDQELANKLKELFDDTNNEQKNVLSDFWLRNSTLLAILCVIPRYSLEATETLLLAQDIIEDRLHLHAKQQLRVGVVGIGAVGTTLAYRLSLSKYVETLNLLDKNLQKTQGTCLDLRHAHAKNSKLKIEAHESMTRLYESSDIVFLCFRSNAPSQHFTGPASERWGKFEPHLDIIKQHATVLAEAQFKGTIIVISNPVDVLTYALYTASQSTKWPLKTYQVFGSGMELDQHRVIHYGKDLGTTTENTHVYGSHSSDISIVTSSGLSPENMQELQKKVMEGSQEIRQYVDRTIYGPVESIVSSFEAMVNNGSTHLTSIQDNVFIGGEIEFRSMLPSKVACDAMNNKMFEKINNDVEMIKKIV